MVDFKPKDFEKLLYPVHTLKKGMDIFSVFPELLDYSEFTETIPPSIDLTKLFKYIVYVYDRQSPFVLQISDLKTRKMEAAIASGFRNESGKGFRQSIIKIFNCEYEQINKMIIRYCRMQGQDVIGLAVDQEAYYQINLQLFKGISSTDEDPIKAAKAKAELSKLANEFRARLNESARDFLTQETERRLQETLWTLAESEAENIKLTPEDYAEEIQEG